VESDHSRALEDARSRAKGASERADHADLRAARYDRLAIEGPAATRDLHKQLAGTQRRIAERHRAAARIQEAFAQRIEESRRPAGGPVPASLVIAVADALGVESAAIVLSSSCHGNAIVVTSDTRANLVQDAELILAEGPSLDVTRSGLEVAVAAAELGRRWPRFATAVEPLGLRGIAAVPLASGATTVGALTVLDPPWPDGAPGLAQLMTVGEALLDTVLEDFRLRPGTLDRSPIMGGNHMPLVHMAVGMVAAQRHCSTSDALALIQAHAYAEGVATLQVALDITERRLDLVD
jgi:hypothetical protein